MVPATWESSNHPASLKVGRGRWHCFAKATQCETRSAEPSRGPLASVVVLYLSRWRRPPYDGLAALRGFRGSFLVGAHAHRPACACGRG